ncbi:hypothetical protein ACFL38_02220 [Candidatus Omnitrophota bacterium]
MNKKITIRYPTLSKVYFTLLVFGIITLITVGIVREQCFFKEFWIFWGGLVAVFVVPMTIIILVMRYAATFDYVRQKTFVTRWFYRYEIPFDRLKINKRSEVLAHGHFWIYLFLIAIGKHEKTGVVWRLYISDNDKEFRITESIFEKHIDRIKTRLEQGMRQSA